MVHAMYFVDKKDVSRGQVGQNGGQVAHALKDGARCGTEVAPHLARYDVSQRGFSQPRRRVEKAVIQSLFSFFRSLYEDPEIFLQLILADKIVECLRPEGIFNTHFLRDHVRRYDAFNFIIFHGL